MRVLITGFTGFVGSHLADHLLERGDCEIYGLYRWRSRMENVNHLLGRVHLIEGDIADASGMRRALEISRPDWVFHLAAQSFVPTSWTSPNETLDVNVRGQINLFEGLRQLSLNPRIQIACSSEEYGLVHADELPIREENPLRPLSPYAVSKVTQDVLAYQYHQSYGIDTVRTRGFNHTGPRRGHVFVCSNFAHQVASIEAGLQDAVIRVGNLDARRDFTDVRDMARGYVLALEKGEPGGCYNICQGKAHRIGDVLDMLLDMARLEVSVEEDPERMRPSDVPVLLGSADRFRERTGWEPRIPFEQTLRDLLDYWRDRLARRTTSTL
ncbi:MAG TPA: GDP-mannose 4,6-dehydratase [Candidatus Krumholzibacteria bacterium]|nr:GDP-mannose 4,6-dehydratase [Candidatus Krumholzibacteria bacterium]